MKGQRMIIKWMFFVFAITLILPITQSNANEKLVYVVPLEETVEKGLYAFLSRAVETAESEGADAIIFEINTPGGAVDAAGEIGKLLTSTNIKTISFINKLALSAGSYIALNTDAIYMVPGSTMGSSAIIDQQGNTAGKKAESFWFAAMKAAAEQSGRDPLYALAMADESIDLPQYNAPKGKLLTLTADQAVEVGYSEGVVSNLDEVLISQDLDGAKIRTIDESFAEKLARFITNPIVVPILLSIGSLGLVLELYSPGFGIPGAMGLSSLLLFFYGHLVAGLAGFETVILFVIGIALVLMEFFLPGGIAGIIGGVAILASLFIASGNIVHMGISILIAITVAIVGSILMVKVFGRKMRLFKRIILTDSTNTESGYISNKTRVELIGLEGVTMTALRPAGTILIEGERLDAVSEGGYIPKDVTIKVVKAEGARIVVREVK